MKLLLDTHALLWWWTEPERLLAAQAMTENALLVTVDAAFASLRGLRTLWAPPSA